jgi:hypothetical protein
LASARLIQILFLKQSQSTTSIKVNIPFWDITLCIMVYGYGCWGGYCCLQLAANDGNGKVVNGGSGCDKMRLITQQ